YRGEGDPEQSYSERQLYEMALDRFAREMVAVNDTSLEEAIKKTEENLKVK
ncbi:MAG: CarD family transcriptional regulator, partial [Gammaproteobacteria bacterium]|nr:CarD family transcriptional regulator [Gammaproteobacteria bacterium]